MSIILNGTAGLTCPAATITGALTVGGGIALTGNITSSGNPSLNLGTGTLTAGAGTFTTLTASGNVAFGGGSTPVASGYQYGIGVGPNGLIGARSSINDYRLELTTNSKLDGTYVSTTTGQCSTFTLDNGTAAITIYPAGSAGAALGTALSSMSLTSTGLAVTGNLSSKLATNKNWSIESDGVNYWLNDARSSTVSATYAAMDYTWKNGAGGSTTAMTLNASSQLDVVGRVSSAAYMWAYSGSAAPAGGNNNAPAYIISPTGSFGIYYGSGAPTCSAAKGSLYLRTDGTTTNDRMYVNTNSGSTWTAVTTVN